MKAITFPGVTRKLGKPLSWDENANGECASLPVQDITVNGSIPCMRSVHSLTLEERLSILFGKNIELLVVGNVHPPISLSTTSAKRPKGDLR